MTRTATTRKLAIYVSDGCFGCDIALELAGQIDDLQLPGLDVTVINLSQPETEQPPQVFAVPTYMLDNTVISLGNPDEQSLLAELDVTAAIPDERTTDLPSN